jgi:hypothetical protein
MGCYRTCQAPKIPDKIWLERVLDKEQLYYRNFSRFKMECELKFREISIS